MTSPHTWAAQKHVVETSMGEAMNLHHYSPFHLHGVGPAYTMKLALCGIETIGELVEYENLEELSTESTIPLGVLKRVKLKAKALLNNEVIQVHPFQMPSERLIFLDIETTLRSWKVWLIGFMVEGRFHQLYAENLKQECRILVKFLDFLQRHEDHVLVTWSSFDTRVLLQRMGQYKLNHKPLISKAHIDLRNKIRQSFIFPTHGYSLKCIGTFLGYPFKNQGLNGLQVALKYMNYIGNGSTLDPRVFSYNEDDVKVLHYITDWANSYKEEASALPFFRSFVRDKFFFK